MWATQWRRCAATMSSRPPATAPSLLLRHLNCSLATLRELYAQEQHNNNNNTTSSSSSSRHDACSRVVPPEPVDDADGERIVQFVSRELDMDVDAVRRWRAQLHALRAPTHTTWGLTPLCASSSTSSSRRSDDNDGGSVTTTRAATTRACALDHAQTRWCVPRAQDVQFVRSAYSDLHAVLSPFVTLSPPPRACAADEHAALLQHYLRAHNNNSNNNNEAASAAVYAPPATRARRHCESSTLYATRDLPAGMFVLSLPTEAVLFAQPPASDDALHAYFLHVDDLVGQLVAASDDARASHHGYARYLMSSVVPCRNLPFLQQRDMEQLLPRQQRQQHDDTVTRATRDNNNNNNVNNANDDDDDSPAWRLWRYFHEDMAGRPLSPYLRTRFASRADDYAWWVSVVLSRRVGAATLVPLLDKLDHSATAANCYYTMSTPASFCGVDVFDNVVAGVRPSLLYEPHVHVFTLRDVRAGEALTVCYASASPHMYTRASSRVPDKPATLAQPPQPPQLPSSSSSVASTHAPRDAMTRAHVARARAAVHDVLYGDGDNRSSSRSTSRAARARSEVDTAEGKAVWQLQWGFVPPRDAMYAASDLRELVTLVAERRVNTRRLLFRPTPAAVNLARPRVHNNNSNNNSNNNTTASDGADFTATPEELRTIQDKMRDPVFAQLMHEYMHSLEDADTLREERAYLEQVEREAKEGGDYSFDFIFPRARFVVELREPTTRRVTRAQAKSVMLLPPPPPQATTKQDDNNDAASKQPSKSSSASRDDVVSTTARTFVNFCDSDKVAPFREETTGDVRGSHWHVPVSVSAKRVELYTEHDATTKSTTTNATHKKQDDGNDDDNNNNNNTTTTTQELCFVYDAVFHPTTLSLAERSDRFMCFLVEIAVEHINAGYGEDNGFAFTRLPRAVCSIGKPRSQTVRQRRDNDGSDSNSSSKTTITATAAEPVLTRPTRHLDDGDGDKKGSKAKTSTTTTTATTKTTAAAATTTTSATTTTMTTASSPQLPPYTITHRGFVDLSDTWSDARLRQPRMQATATTAATTNTDASSSSSSRSDAHDDNDASTGDAQTTTCVPRVGVPDVLVVTMTFAATVTRAAQLDVQLSDDGTSLQLAATAAQPHYAGVLVLPFTVQPTPQRATFDRARHVLTLELRVVPPQPLLVTTTTTTTKTNTQTTTTTTTTTTCADVAAACAEPHDDDGGGSDDVKVLATAMTTQHVDDTQQNESQTTVAAATDVATTVSSNGNDSGSVQAIDAQHATANALSDTNACNTTNDNDNKLDNNNNDNNNNTSSSRSHSPEMPMLAPVLECIGDRERAQAMLAQVQAARAARQAAAAAAAATTTTNDDATNTTSAAAVTATAANDDETTTTVAAADTAAADATTSALAGLHAQQDAWRAAQLQQSTAAEAAAAAAAATNEATAATRKAHAMLHAQRAAEQLEAAARAKMQALPLRNAYIFAID